MPKCIAEFVRDAAYAHGAYDRDNALQAVEDNGATALLHHRSGFNEVGFYMFADYSVIRVGPQSAEVTRRKL